MARGSDLFPSGSWAFGPVTIQWSLQSDDKIVVHMSVLGIDVDEVSGTLSPTNPKLTSNLNILSTIRGHIILEAKLGEGANADGLWVEDQVTAPGFDTGLLNLRLATRP